MTGDVSTKPHWRREGLASAWFHYVATHAWAAKMMGRLWRTDTDVLWRDIALLKDLPDGSSVLDVPSGGGSAFRGVPTDRKIRYVAVDIAAEQLARAKAEAVEWRVGGVEFVQGDVMDLSYQDDTFDVAVSYGGLHCFEDPQGALTEIARVLRPGSEVRGSTVVKSNIASRLLVRACERAGTMGPSVGTIEQLGTWMRAAGYQDVRLRKSGLLVYFSGRTPK